MLDTPEKSTEPRFRGFTGLLDQYKEGSLMLNAVEDASRNKISGVRLDPEHFGGDLTPSMKDEDTFVMVIGTKKGPPAIERKIRSGALNEDERILVIKSHEYAHTVMDLYEKNVVDLLNERIKKVPEWCASYVHLYTTLMEMCWTSDPLDRYPESEKSELTLTGLASLEEYRHEERLDYELRKSPQITTIVEDMAELIGAYMLGDEYYKFRLRNNNFRLPKDVEDSIKDSIARIVQYFIESQTKKH